MGRGMTDNDDILINQSDPRVPSVMKSEAGIKEKAPAALRVLERIQGMDLVEMLGLSPYLEGGSSGSR